MLLVNRVLLRRNCRDTAGILRGRKNRQQTQINQRHFRRCNSAHQTSFQTRVFSCDAEQRQQLLVCGKDFSSRAKLPEHFAVAHCRRLSKLEMFAQLCVRSKIFHSARLIVSAAAHCAPDLRSVQKTETSGSTKVCSASHSSPAGVEAPSLGQISTPTPLTV